MLDDVRFAQTNKIGPCLHLPYSENIAPVWIVTNGRQMHQMGPHAPAIPPRNKNRPVYTGTSPELTAFPPAQSPTSPIRARSPLQHTSPPANLSSATPNATVPQSFDIPQSASLRHDASHVPPPWGLPIPSPNLSETRATRTRFLARRSDLCASRTIAGLCPTHLNRRCNKGRLLGKGPVVPLRGGAASPKVLIPSMHPRHHLSCAASRVIRVARALQGQLPTKMDPLS